MEQTSVKIGIIQLLYLQEIKEEVHLMEISGLLRSNMEEVHLIEISGLLRSNVKEVLIMVVVTDFLMENL